MTTGTTSPVVRGVAIPQVAAMEPRRGDGDDERRPSRDAVAGDAAMEPRRDDGDDPAMPSALRPWLRWPQWSPVVTTGTTKRCWTSPVWRTSPQWSPVVTTGTTIDRRRRV